MAFGREFVVIGVLAGEVVAEAFEFGETGFSSRDGCKDIGPEESERPSFKVP